MSGMIVVLTFLGGEIESTKMNFNPILYSLYITIRNSNEYYINVEKVN